LCYICTKAGVLDSLEKEHRLSFAFFKGSLGPAVSVIAAVLFFVFWGIGGYTERRVIGVQQKKYLK
jgi:hypothetical protein